MTGFILMVTCSKLVRNSTETKLDVADMDEQICYFSAVDLRSKMMHVQFSNCKHYYLKNQSFEVTKFTKMFFGPLQNYRNFGFDNFEKTV